ncbi:uncharacterized protein VTP21DRAFT_1730 [Calcarisporiella thermophila]|uniref:uncharacterized protein n=1 Tax=Calcarisporiella thermophila TaxID=911321 RepID=UPI0037423791
MTTPLEEYKIKNAPPNLYYIPDIITPQEEEYILSKVYTAPRPKWVVLKNRRLQNWGGVPSDKGMFQQPLPTWLTSIPFAKFRQLGIFLDPPPTNTPFDPNHVLVNEYLAGQGIMPHEDGPIYFPTVATISLGSHTVLNFYRRGETTPIFCLYQEPRSLLVLKEDMYKEYLHGIEELMVDNLSTPPATILNPERLPPGVDERRELRRTSRVSLTYRKVTRVAKTKLFR